MQKIKNITVSKVFIFCALTALMLISFTTGVFTNKQFFKNNFMVSQNLVTGKMLADKNNVETFGAGYGDLVLNEDGIYSFNKWQSHYALQGRVFSFLYNNLGLSAGVLEFGCALLTSLTFIWLCVLLGKRYGLTLGLVFYFVFVLSPWTAAIARNLYWLEFLMFLPAVIALLLLNALRENKNWQPYILIVFLVSFIKSLCGYEFLSAIMLMPLSFMAAEYLLAKDAGYKKNIVIAACWFAFAFVAGFACALVLHALTRAGGIVAGLKEIWQNDVLRRTYSANPEYFRNWESGHEYEASLKASVFTVIWQYIRSFYPSLIFPLPGWSFSLLSFAAFCVLCFNTFKTKKIISLENIMFILLFLTAISWFAAAKGHSYIHRHINYILWYFGFVQAVFYIIVTFCLRLMLPKNGPNAR